MFDFKSDPKNATVYVKLNSIKKDQFFATRQAYYKIGKFLVKDAQAEILKKPKHGRVYLVRLGKTKRKHIASAPDEAPANLTGSLRKAHDFNVSGASKLEFGVKEEFTNRRGKFAETGGVTYGKYLELGTKRIVARKWLEKTIKRNEKAITEVFNTELKNKFDKK